MRRPLAVWTTINPWIEQIVAEVAPPQFDVAFCDLDDEQQVRQILPQADFLVCVRLPARQASLLQRCRLVMHNGVGYDAIDLETLRRLGIPLALTPALTAEGVAEHALMLMLALNKQLIGADRSVRRGEFDMFGWRQGSHTLYGKTVGIIGLGRIGKRLAHLLHALGCQLLFNDIVPMPAGLVARYGLEAATFEGLIERSNVISVHVPLTAATRTMFGWQQFARMRRGAIFINTSRGATYDLDALCDSVQQGHLRGAGIDVFEPEPPPTGHPIFQLENVICTPHIASGTVERQYAINRAQFANFQRVLRGEPIVDLVT